MGGDLRMRDRMEYVQEYEEKHNPAGGEGGYPVGTPNPKVGRLKWVQKSW